MIATGDRDSLFVYFKVKSKPSEGGWVHAQLLSYNCHQEPVVIGTVGLFSTDKDTSYAQVVLTPTYAQENAENVHVVNFPVPPLFGVRLLNADGWVIDYGVI